MKRLNAVRSKKELVIAEIREAILSGELAPGGRLVIEDLAGKLGVSTIPVREALQQLHADHCVRAVHWCWSHHTNRFDRILSLREIRSPNGTVAADTALTRSRRT